MHGAGVLTALDKTVYDGYFENGKRNGRGRFSVQGTPYVFESDWKDDVPEFESNQLLYIPIKKPEEEETKPDPKKNPDPKKK